MSSSPNAAEATSSPTWPDTPATALRILEHLPSLRGAASAESATALFGQLLPMFGAGSGIFLSAIADDAIHTSIRSLLACDPEWASEYSRHGWQDRDPWLRHALDSQTPIRSTQLVVHPWEEAFVRKASRLGFASALVVPAPTSFGAACVGVLILGSNRIGHFEGEHQALLEIVARALAMELHEWLLRTVRDDLLERSGITPDQIALLRREAAGHTSKMIAAELDINPKAVDRRFARAMAKLDAPDRRTAVRIARLYGLLREAVASEPECPTRPPPRGT